MGTRAQFFLGDPRDLEKRKWLGTVAWDGYPNGDIGEALGDATTEKEFLIGVKMIQDDRNDFCDPEKNGFPFPWTENLFLTDCTYAWFDGKVQFTYFNRGFISLQEYLSSEDVQEKYHDHPKQLSDNVPAPGGKWDRSGPVSIMIVSVKE